MTFLEAVDFFTLKENKTMWRPKKKRNKKGIKGIHSLAKRQ